jgi:phenylpyruvate tautomerase PptA (4-oxalocrotonate tautomerase family)
MPLVTVYTSAPAPSEDRRSALLLQLSRTLAEQLRKPETYVMTCLVPQTRMTFAGTEAPACYVEVKSIGNITPDVTRALSADLCARLGEALGVAQDRIYIEFADVQRHLWGYNGSTFG